MMIRLAVWYRECQCIYSYLVLGDDDTPGGLVQLLAASLGVVGVPLGQQFVHHAVVFADPQCVDACQTWLLVGPEVTCKCNKDMPHVDLMCVSVW